MVYCKTTVCKRLAWLAATAILIAAAPSRLTTGTPPEETAAQRLPSVEEARANGAVLIEQRS